MKKSKLSPPRETTLSEEFDRQVDVLTQLGYHKLAGMPPEQFLALIKPLKKRLNEITNVKHDLPFAIVVKGSLIPPHSSVPQIKWEGNHGVITLYPRKISDFKLVEGVNLPAGNAYLVVGIDARGGMSGPPDKPAK